MTSLCSFLLDLSAFHVNNYLLLLCYHLKSCQSFFRVTISLVLSKRCWCFLSSVPILGWFLWGRCLHWSWYLYRCLSSFRSWVDGRDIYLLIISCPIQPLAVSFFCNSFLSFPATVFSSFYVASLSELNVSWVWWTCAHVDILTLLGIDFLWHCMRA